MRHLKKRVGLMLSNLIYIKFRIKCGDNWTTILFLFFNNFISATFYTDSLCGAVMSIIYLIFIIVIFLS